VQLTADGSRSIIQVPECSEFSYLPSRAQLCHKSPHKGCINAVSSSPSTMHHSGPSGALLGRSTPCSFTPKVSKWAACQRRFTADLVAYHFRRQRGTRCDTDLYFRCPCAGQGFSPIIADQQIIYTAKVHVRTHPKRQFDCT